MRNTQTSPTDTTGNGWVNETTQRTSRFTQEAPSSKRSTTLPTHPMTKHTLAGLSLPRRALTTRRSFLLRGVSPLDSPHTRDVSSSSFRRWVLQSYTNSFYKPLSCRCQYSFTRSRIFFELSPSALANSFIRRVRTPLLFLTSSRFVTRKVL